jgi:hypothetical protein
VDWLRKMLLGGLLMLLHRGSIVQVFCGLLISFGFFGLHVALRPYRKGPTNWLKACIEIQIFLTLLISLVTRFADKLATDVMDVAGYEWLVVVTFVLLVPVAFCVCTALTIRQSRRQKRHDAEMEQPLLNTFTTLGEPAPAPEPVF